MTHDELLELIAANEEFYDDGTNRTPSWSALRAVVEFCRKYGDDYYTEDFASEIIQVIEKELG